MRRLVIGIVISVGLSLSAIAQVATSGLTELYGNPQQPGYKLQTAVYMMIEDGESLEAASASVLNSAVGENATMLSPPARSAVLSNSQISLKFVQEMYTANDLFDVVKTTIESFPDEAIQVITLGVTLYPDFAQTVVDAATLTGEIDANDALIAAISAGADPTAVSVATAAGPAAGVAATAAPLGAGIGAGGTGGGDTTASIN